MADCGCFHSIIKHYERSGIPRPRAVALGMLLRAKHRKFATKGPAWTHNPIGPYPNFDACVEDQQEKGHSIESSRRICGRIEQKTRE